MAPKKGFTNNPNGRPKGTPNKTTQEARELLDTVLLGQVDNIASALERLKQESDAKYIDACVKLFQYVLPKKTDITSKDQSINPLTINFDPDSKHV